MRKGLTLIEIVIVIALIATLVGVYFLVANPAGQIASSRNNRRKIDLENILIAIKNNASEQGNEQFLCAAGPIPTSTKVMGSAAGNYNIAPCIIPSWIALMPFDPSASSSYYNSPSDYNTNYAIVINASGTVVLSAPNAELGKTITITQ
jgi:prepilin-type N-terminal cleavage/methylation domain-containing protein